VNVPFRIGATSFVYPDRWLPNVERLAGRVDDVEILVFEPELPDRAELAALANLKQKSGLTYDLGHLHRDGRPEREVLRRNLRRTRVIQWHGVDASGRDHRSLALYPRERARALLDLLLTEPYCGVLTLEVFREDDFEESFAVLRDLLAEAHS
jgi:sugar phosphate isomerase/epimerase